MRVARVVFYVEVPAEESEPVTRLKAARLAVPGWPDFGFRAEVIEVEVDPEEWKVEAL